MTIRDYLHKISQTVFQYQIPRLKKRGEELFALLDKPEHEPNHSRIRGVIERLMIPATSMLIDYIGLAKILAHRMNSGEKIDPRMLELLDDLEEIPSEAEQQARWNASADNTRAITTPSCAIPRNSKGRN